MVQLQKNLFQKKGLIWLMGSVNESESVWVKIYMYIHEHMFVIEHAIENLPTLADSRQSVGNSNNISIMALLRNRSGEIPKDAVILTEDEALTFQWKIISNWDNLRDVWALRYSSGALGAFSAVSSIFINSHYRTKLRLGNYGKLTSYLPIVVIPAMFSVLTHRFFVQRPILLGKLDNKSSSPVCPLCLQLRSAAFQSSFGVIYPIILSPLAALMYATRHYTYRLPSITSEPLEVFRLYRKITKPIVPMLTTFFIVHTIAAMFITYNETKEIITLQKQYDKIEKSIEEGSPNFY